MVRRDGWKWCLRLGPGAALLLTAASLALAVGLDYEQTAAAMDMDRVAATIRTFEGFGSIVRLVRTQEDPHRDLRGEAARQVPLQAGPTPHVGEAMVPVEAVGDVAHAGAEARERALARRRVVHRLRHHVPGEAAAAPLRRGMHPGDVVFGGCRGLREAPDLNVSLTGSTIPFATLSE